MRRLLVAAVFAVSTTSFAQPSALPNAPQPANWQGVQALPPDTPIHVKAQSGSVKCSLRSVVADSLSCMHGNDTVTFQNAEIRSIAIPHRGRSTLVGLAIGGGGGAIIGFALGTGGNSNSFLGKNAFRGPITAIFAVGGGLAGAGIGAATDFTHSTVYKVSR